jgi:hypothetical protein
VAAVAVAVAVAASEMRPPRMASPRVIGLNQARRRVEQTSPTRKTTTSPSEYGAAFDRPDQSLIRLGRILRLSAKI